MNSRLRLALVSLSLLGTGCSLAIGSFEECKADADCAAKGAGLVCTEGLCVQPAATPDGGVTDPIAEKCTHALGAEAGEGVITFGAVLPYTTSDGKDDARGKARENAVALALDEINQREGVNGKRRLRVVACDTAGDPANARTEAAYLIRDVKVPAILTQGSGDTLAVTAETITKGVLVMSASATTPELTSLPDKQSPNDPAGLVWRTAPSDALQGRVLADMVKADLAANPSAANKVGILFIDDPYGQGLSSVFLERFGTGGPPTKSALFKAGGPDLAIPLGQLESFKPTVMVVIAVGGDVAAALKAIDSTKPNLSAARYFFSDGGKNATLLKQAGRAYLENSRGTAPAVNTAAPAFASFSSRYQSKFSADPAQSSFTAQTYDSTYLLALAASRAATSAGTGEINGVRMAEALTHFSSGTSRQLQPTDYVAARSDVEAAKDINAVGASGALDFDPATGEAPSPIEEWKYTNAGAGNIETVTTHDPM